MKNTEIFALLAVIVVSLLGCSFLVSSVEAGHNPTWWDYDWGQRIEYTINHTLVDEDLVNFPVLIYIDENLVDWGDIQNSLDDIRFIGNYLDELDFEIDSFMLNSEAWFRVRLPEISSSLDTYFFMYFDNKFCESGENAEAVWDTDFVMVQHMNDETTSTILDSTNYDNDGVKKAANEPIESAGKTAKAQYFDGINDYITISDSASLHTFTGITVECWVSPSTLGDTLYWRNIFNKGWSSEGSFVMYADKDTWSVYWGLYLDGSDRMVHTDSGLNIDVWTHLVGTYDGTWVRLYRDGVEQANPTWCPVASFSNDADLILGGPDNRFHGTHDEARVSDVARSDAWIKASYHSEVLELAYEGYHTGVSYARRGEFIAAALVASLICVPLFILVIFAARRK